MRAQPIDPRDAEWEADAEAYRVVFWSGPGRCEEHELTDAADVVEVLRWVEEHRAGRTAEVFVRRTAPEGLGLIRLLGGRPD